MSQSIICSSCGAKNLIADNEDSMLCKYCASPIVKPKTVDDTEIVNVTINSGWNTQKIGTYMELALKARNAKKFVEATDYYDKVLELDPVVAEAYYGKAYCHAWATPLTELDNDKLIDQFAKAQTYSADAVHLTEMRERVAVTMNEWAITMYDASCKAVDASSHKIETYADHIYGCIMLLTVLSSVDMDAESAIDVIHTGLAISGETKVPKAYKNSDGTTTILRADSDEETEIELKYRFFHSKLPFDDPILVAERRKGESQKALAGIIMFCVCCILFFYGCRRLYASVTRYRRKTRSNAAKIQ